MRLIPLMLLAATAATAQALQDPPDNVQVPRAFVQKLVDENAALGIKNAILQNELDGIKRYLRDWQVGTNCS